MAITQVKQISRRNCGIDSSNNRTYVRTYHAITDDMLTTMVDVLTDSRVPQKGSYDIYDRFAECVDVQCEVPDEDDPYLWHIVGTWKTGGRNVDARDIDLALQASNPDQARADGNQHQETPTAQPIQVSWDFIPASKIFTKSFDILEDSPPQLARAVQNSAFQDFDPPLEMDDGTLQLTIVQSVANFDPEAAALYYQTCNDAEWNGYPAGSVRLVEWSAKKAYEKRTSYWSQTFRFLFARRVVINGETFTDWDYHVRDKGTQYLEYDGVAVYQVSALDRYGNGIEVDLGGTGGLLSSPDDDPYYLWFRAYPRLDFDALGIPAF
jgi:hypothetical protein